MTVHIMSVGVSILDTLKAPNEIDLSFSAINDITANLPSALIADWQAMKEDRGRRFRVAAQAAVTGGFDDLGLRQLVDRASTESWPSRISAETDSLARSGGPLHQHHLKAGDVVVLLASDTAPGVTAAFWVAAAMTAGDLDAITWVDDLAALDAVTERRPTVLVVPIKGMDVGDHRGFKTAMGQLGGLLHTLLQVWVKSADSVEFHLSGGYKASIAYLLAMAEWARTASDQPVTAWVLHEQSDGRISLPLRRLYPAADEMKYIRKLNSPSLDQPRGNALEGYAYEKNARGRWERTAFGNGLVRALPTSAGN